MAGRKKVILLYLIFTVSSAFGTQQHTSRCDTASSLERFLASLPVESVKKIEPRAPFIEEYEIVLKQVLDHRNSESGLFPQRVFVSYVDSTASVVIITEGYSLRANHLRELSEILGANQIRVEYRFYGKSVPDTIPWKYLNYFQSSNDYHRIIGLFKRFFTGKWISTGWSKGGQTALIFRRFFPEDVALTVAYDAPLNLSVEDPRINNFFEEVGTPQCRRKIVMFQRLVLSNKDKIVPKFKQYCDQKGYKFKRITPEKSLEYCVLEYPFSFWQYHHIPCSDIPDSTSSYDDLFKHLKKVVWFGSYTDRAFDSISMYQFATELGYYGYVTKNVADLLLEGTDSYKNTAFAPEFLDVKFNPAFMEDIVRWLCYYGNKIIYIYGENDPWSAPSLDIPKDLNALKIYVKNGNHYSFINTFPKEERSEIINKIKEWLK